MEELPCKHPQTIHFTKEKKPGLNQSPTETQRQMRGFDNYYISLALLVGNRICTHTLPQWKNNGGS